MRIEDTWRQMEKLVDDRLVKAIGLANFNKEQIQRILNSCKYVDNCEQMDHSCLLRGGWGDGGVGQCHPMNATFKPPPTQPLTLNPVYLE